MKKSDRVTGGISSGAPLQRVRREGGEEMVFDVMVLEQSIIQAFAHAGQPDEFTARSITETVYERLQKTFNGATVPSTEDVATVVDAVLMERGLAAVKDAYHGIRVTPPKPVAMPVVAPTSTPSIPEPIPEPLKRMTPTTTTASGELYTPRRRRLPEERKALTHKFQVGDQEGYLTVGLYDDGQPGEIFLKMSKEGSDISGFMDAFATAVSIGLQYGVPLKVLANKFSDTRFAPNGPTKNPNIPETSSVMDYIFRWLALKFLTPEERQAIGLMPGGKADGAFAELPGTSSLL